MKKIPVGILGATGMVGQQYLYLLQSHPFFEVATLAASSESKGKTYEEAVKGKWSLPYSVPSYLKSMKMYSAQDVDLIAKKCKLIFSAVEHEVASKIEMEYAKEGCAVISHASTYRMDPNVPLLIPEINSHHLNVLEKQRNLWKVKGFIIAKPNCSIQSYLLPLAPLHERFGLKRMHVTTLQAISGAGFPGISSLTMTDNVVPFIEKEEEKTEKEPLKILGSLTQEGILNHQKIVISAHCNRVAVLDGHLACVSVEFEVKPDREQILKSWKQFQSVPQKLLLPSSPEIPIVYKEEEDRPQPRLDREAGQGMAVTVGRVRECPLLHFRFVGLSHNRIRGAAGGGLLNAELLYVQNFLKEL